MLDQLSRAAAARLGEFATAAAQTGWKWCLFGGAAVNCYGGDRPLHDVDVVTDARPRVVTRVLGWPLGIHGVPVARSAPHIEVWPSPLVFDLPGHRVVLPLDTEALARCRFLPGPHGQPWSYLGPEDLMLIKAVQQRGAEQEKHDLDDVVTLLESCSDALDWPYFWSRVTRLGLMARVERALAAAGGRHHRPTSPS